MKNGKLLGVVFGVVLLGGAPLRAQCPQLVFSDEFNGTSLDGAKWEAQIGDGCDIGLCGWGNNELQWYLAENAQVSNGVLTITAKKQRQRSRSYTSARLRTKGLAEWTYGRFEARIQLPRGQGIWPAFWMLSSQEVYGGWPQSGEIDIMEMRGQSVNVVYGTIHFGEPFPSNRSTGNTYHLRNADFSGGFHVYAIEWEPGEIRWYVDDTLFSRKTPQDLRGRLWPFDQDFHLLLNVAVGGGFVGTPDDSVLPQSMSVDYVRVYDGGRPALEGDFSVAENASNVLYTVRNVSGSGVSYAWSVPAGTSITSGQGTPSIQVDWGSSGGDVTLQLSTSCGSSTLVMPVEVEQAQALGFTFEDFETERNLNLLFASGTLIDNDANPGPSPVNPSAVVGQYTRDASSKYDVIVYGTSDIPDAGPLADGSDSLRMDVFSGAPVGTEITLQLEDSSVAAGDNFPQGRHSAYLARTGAQGEWEALRFAFNGRLDGNTPDSAVDSIVVLIDGGWESGDTYHFDNLARYVPSGGPGGCTPSSVHVGAIALSTQNAGQGNKRGQAQVSLLDDCGSASAGADVTGTFSGAFNETQTAAGNSQGVATLLTSSTAKGSLSFTFCVDSVSHPSLPYNSGDNQQTCAVF